MREEGVLLVAGGADMKAAQYAKYFIRAVLIIVFVMLVMTVIHVLTPKIDLFTFVGVHWDIDHPKGITYSYKVTFNY